MGAGPGGWWCLLRRHGGASGSAKPLLVAVFRRRRATTMDMSGCWVWCNWAKAFTDEGGHDGGDLWALTSLLGASWWGTMLRRTVLSGWRPCPSGRAMAAAGRRDLLGGIVFGDLLFVLVVVVDWRCCRLRAWSMLLSGCRGPMGAWGLVLRCLVRQWPQWRWRGGDALFAVFVTWVLGGEWGGGWGKAPRRVTRISGRPLFVTECVLKLLWIGGIDGCALAVRGWWSHGGGARGAVRACSGLRLWCDTSLVTMAQ
jgi:hypothetical protein